MKEKVCGLSIFFCFMKTISTVYENMKIRTNIVNSYLWIVIINEYKLCMEKLKKNVLF